MIGTTSLYTTKWEYLGYRLISPLGSYVVFLFITSSLIFAFQYSFEKEYGMMFGKDDIKNYYIKAGMDDTNYFNDVNHYATLNVAQRLGYPFYTSFLFYFLTPLALYWMFRNAFNEMRSVLASFTATYLTIYMAHATYVGILSQTASYFFFILMLGFTFRNKTSESVFCCLNGILFHYVTAVAYGIFYLIRCFREFKWIYLIMGLLCCLTTISYVLPSPISPGVTVSEIIIPTSTSEYEPPMWYVMAFMNNPILIIASGLNGIYYLTFLTVSAFVDNGRMTLFLIPFMVYQAFKNKTKCQLLYIIVLSGIWTMVMQVNFIIQTFDYLFKAGIYP